MMCGDRRSPVTVAASAALALAAALAIAMPAVGSASGRAVAARRVYELTSTSPLTLSPKPDDLALAETQFVGGGRRASISRGNLRVEVAGPFGDDYMAAAKVRLPGVRRPTVLLMLVNRPSPLLDPVSVHLRLHSSVVLGSKATAESFLGIPVTLVANNPLWRRSGAPLPRLCRLPLHGVPLTAAELAPIVSHGSPLAGIVAAEAVAQAYDIACGLPHASAFEQAVSGGATSPPQPAPAPPAPGPPAPPPPGEVPGEECRREARPGVACPEVAAPTSAPLPLDAARRAFADAH